MRRPRAQAVYNIFARKPGGFSRRDSGLAPVDFLGRCFFPLGVGIEAGEQSVQRGT